MTMLTEALFEHFGTQMFDATNVWIKAMDHPGLAAAIDAEVPCARYKHKFKSGQLNTQAIRGALRRCKGIRVLPRSLFCVDTLGEKNRVTKNATRML
jgi:hypothetical protein